MCSESCGRIEADLLWVCRKTGNDLLLAILLLGPRPVQRCKSRGPDRPSDLTNVADLVMHCSKRDLTLPLELTADLPLECLLTALDAQQKAGPERDR